MSQKKQIVYDDRIFEVEYSINPEDGEVLPEIEHIYTNHEIKDMISDEHFDTIYQLLLLELEPD